MKKKKPYLGPLLLAWCDTCNVPLIRKARCGRCGNQTRDVPITPPGDVRPAFTADREQIINSLSKLFSQDVAQKLIPSDKIVLLNAIPDIDCCEEVIVDGQIIGLHRYRVETLSWEFIPKIEGARRLVKLTKAKQVVIEDTAVRFIVGGANLLRPGIKTADSTISQGDYVIGVTEEGKAIFVGIAMMTGAEMRTKERGVAVKKRYKAEPSEHQILPSGQTMEQVLEANAKLLQRIEQEAITFIQQTSEKYHLPIAVAFSGGKDSLAVLLLTQKALLDRSFNVMFVDTGIEFPETVKNVYSTASKLGVENHLLVTQVSKDQFFQVLNLYGFVARDYRVCCKSVKLGPTSQLIEKHFPKGCLSFIGQRRYESIRRSGSGRIWRNPWVPKQVGASPIHNWTALMIWLYLFQEKAPYNPLYEAGFERIGCMFCPASNMNEFEIIASRYPNEWEQWISTAKQIAKKQGYDPKWVHHGFWRWKKPPPKVVELALKMGLDLEPSVADSSEALISYDYSIEQRGEPSGVLINGRFSKPINLVRAAAFLYALGDVVLDLERSMLEISLTGNNGSGHGFIFETGYFVISGEPVKETAELILKTVLRGLLCTSCGTCATLCSSGAIVLEERQAHINNEKCIRCGKCLRGKCPSLYATN
ncbi:MAG: phosphoadenosine phosphosulfate reductase family protein [Candidatus Hodarchaeota archaeon]